MRVLYPKLVEEAYNYIAKAEPAVKNAPNAVKSEIYSKMVNDGIIDENGEPHRQLLIGASLMVIAS